jgi:hypothetical protein
MKLLTGRLTYVMVCTATTHHALLTEPAPEMKGLGAYKWWFRWRLAWGRIPDVSIPVPLQELQSTIASSTIEPQVLPSERRQFARQHLMSKVPRFIWKQCHIRNKSESLAYAKQRDHEPFSTRGHF